MPTCPACGQDNPEIAKFCLACGTPLARAPVAVEEERRVVTAVFTDLVGSTSRAEQLDAEDVRAMLTPYYTRLRRELERHGGTVEKFIGDAVVALFGAPVSHEDDAERAVRAALAIQDAISDLNEGDAWLDLRVRIGVNTGEALVVLGARASEGEGMAAGDVMNTAARLQSHAPVNGIVVGAETYRATAARIEYREAEPIQAKGKSEPVRVWEVVGVREELSRGDPGVPLVGRAGDVELLHELWDSVRSERSRLVAVVVGAPGIGKSRLLAEFLAGAGDTGRVLRGRCLSYGEGITYWPVTEIVKEAAGIQRGDGPETVSRKLGSLLDGLPTSDRDELRTMAVAVANLLGVATTPRATYAAGEISGHELHWGVRRVLELLAAERPLLLVLEDLHWAEPTLLDLIRYVAEGSTTAPMLVVASARPELLESRHPLTSGNGYRRLLELGVLSELESEALLRELTQSFELPSTLVHALLRKAAGNPLFLEESARMLLDEGFLGPEGFRGDLESLPIPSSLQALIGSRLDRLPTTEKGVAQRASVVGAVFWSGAVAALARANGELEGALDGLGRRDIVRAHDVSSVAGEREYAFKHALIRDVAYGRLPKGHRAELHVRFADWLCEAPGPEDDFIEILAYHLEQACRLAGEIVRSPIPAPTLRATRALARAADKAERREGWREAHRYYERALELIGEEEPDLELELRLRRGRMLGGLGRLSEACEELAQVAEDALGRARPDLRCAALVTLGNIDQRQGRPAAARERLLDAQGLASELGDRSLEVRAAFGFAALRADFDGAYTEAAESLRHAVGVAEAIDDHALRVEGHLRLGFLLFNMGELGAAQDELRRCSELAAEVGSFRDQARAAFLLGLVTYYRGDPGEAERLNLQARDWLERTCEPFFQIQNFRALGLYALARDEPETAERWLREAFPLALEEGGRFVLEVYRYLAEALVRQGRIEDAGDLVEFAGRNVPEEDLAARAYVLLARAMVAAERADRDAAESFYQAGLGLLEEQHLPIEVGEARIEFARALRRFGALTEAQSQLELARDAFERMGAVGLASEIDRALSETRSGAGPADPARSQ